MNEDFLRLDNDLKTEFIGKKIHVYESVTSTQDIAVEMVQKRLLDNGSVIIAKEQTKGKGRLNRRWFSPIGGLWFSIILKNPPLKDRISLLPIITGLCICKSLKSAYKINSKLKWPNDVVLESGDKVAGILIESSVGGPVEYIIIGVGTNVNIDTSSVEEKIRQTDKQGIKRNYSVGTVIPPSSSSSFAGRVSTRDGQELKKREFLLRFFSMFEHYFIQLRNGNVQNIIKEWTDNSETIGRFVRLSTYYNTVKEGYATGIDENGFLIIKTIEGKKNHINSAEIQ